MKVTEIPMGKFTSYQIDTPNFGVEFVMNGRELIKRANYYSENRGNKDTKNESKCERAFVRDEIQKNGEEADAIFPKSKFSDPWSWD